MEPSQLELTDFDFSYPEALVAQSPLVERDGAKLLIRQADGHLVHSHIKKLAEALKPGTLLVMNDSRVIPSRIFGTIKTGAKIELLLLEPNLQKSGGNFWFAIGKPLKKLKSGEKIFFEPGLEIEVVDLNRDDNGLEPMLVKINLDTNAFDLWLEKYGYVPLPPYIRRDNPVPAPRSADYERYQTVYADSKGSAAAPTAGLHFTDDLLNHLHQKGVELAYVTLHVGAGTFLPVKASQIHSHKMHKERYSIKVETLQAMFKAQSEGRPIVAVGTTSLRCMESYYRAAKGSASFMELNCGKMMDTDLFIFPRTRTDVYRPWAINGLLTNFHQPCSTLYMLVSALIGLDSVRSLYEEAIAKQYRLFSYGDTSLLWL